MSDIIYTTKYTDPRKLTNQSTKSSVLFICLFAFVLIIGTRLLTNHQRQARIQDAEPTTTELRIQKQYE